MLFWYFSSQCPWLLLLRLGYVSRHHYLPKNYKKFLVKIPTNARHIDQKSFNEITARGTVVIAESQKYPNAKMLCLL